MQELEPLKRQLAAWDGKSKQSITAIYTHFHNHHGFVDALCQSFKDEELHKSASWLLKHLLEQDFKHFKRQHKHLKYSKEDIEMLFQQQSVSLENRQTIFSQLKNLQHWQTKLHLLQSLPYLLIIDEYKDGLAQFLRLSLIDQNKFVRAWAYHGFYLLSCEYPQFKEEAEQFLKMGLRDEPASVKARIRNITKDHN